MCVRGARRGGFDAGFTLIELLAVVVFMAIIMAIAVPQVQSMTAAARLSSGVREVERELQAARLQAVSSNRPIRLRFNCPAAGQYRLVELIGTPSNPDAADGAANRCNPAVYPYPAPDMDRLTLPNWDGPVRLLPYDVTFGAVAPLEFWPDGTVHQQAAAENPWNPVPAAGVNLTVAQGANTKTITVTSVGKIQVLP